MCVGNENLTPSSNFPAKFSDFGFPLSVTHRLREVSKGNLQNLWPNLKVLGKLAWKICGNSSNIAKLRVAGQVAEAN